MTRGKIILVSADKMYISTEFNGDMYYDHHGKDVIRGLKKVDVLSALSLFVRLFNDYNFGYPDVEVSHFITINDYDKMLDFSEGYFDKWFSDYLYFKNISGDDLVFTLRWSETNKEKERYVLPNNGIAVFHFGEVATDVPHDLMDGHFIANPNDAEKDFQVSMEIRGFHTITVKASCLNEAFDKADAAVEEAYENLDCGDLENVELLRHNVISN